MLEFRNKRTSEYRKVDEGSEEHLALLAERQPEAPQRTIWEQVGRHTREAFDERLEVGALDTTDYGDDLQPINRGPGDTRSNREALTINATKDVARQTPTPAERAQGAGRAAEGANLDQRLRGADSATKHLEGSEADLDEEYTPEDDPEAEHPEYQTNVGGEETKEAAKTDAPDGDSGDDDGGSSDSSDGYDDQDVDVLSAEAADRDLEVEGTGKNGNVLKADLIKALREDDSAGQE